MIPGAYTQSKFAHSGRFLDWPDEHIQSDALTSPPIVQLLLKKITTCEYNCTGCVNISRLLFLMAMKCFRCVYIWWGCEASLILLLFFCFSSEFESVKVTFKHRSMCPQVQIGFLWYNIYIIRKLAFLVASSLVLRPLLPGEDSTSLSPHQPKNSKWCRNNLHPLLKCQIRAGQNEHS